MRHIKTFLIGIVLGISNVIPGVSGGTMAVVFNVYDKIIDLVSFDFRKIIRNLPFLLVLIGGMATGVIAFSKLLSWLLIEHSVPVNYGFIGIICGSIPLIYSKAVSEQSSRPNFTAVLIGLAAMVAMLVIKSHEGSNAVVTSASPAVVTWLIVMGAVAAFTMIIPGISGSLIMVVFGAYTTFVRAVSDLNIPLLIPIAIGVGVGLLGGATLVRNLLSRFPRATYSVILGLVAGSILPVFPGISHPLPVLVASMLALLAGFAVSMAFSRSEMKTAATHD